MGLSRVGSLAGGFCGQPGALGGPSPSPCGLGISPCAHRMVELVAWHLRAQTGGQERTGLRRPSPHAPSSVLPSLTSDLPSLTSDRSGREAGSARGDPASELLRLCRVF